VRSVGFLVDGFVFERGGEAGPAAAGVKFCSERNILLPQQTHLYVPAVGRFILAGELGIGAFWRVT